MVETKKRNKSVTTKPAPVTPINQVAVLETDGEDSDLALAASDAALTNHPQDLVPQETIRAEVNFLTLPFFALRDKDVHERTETEYKAVVNRDGQPLEISWNVSAHPKYGYPSPFDRKVHRAIEHIISGMKKPIENPIPLGALSSLAKLIGLKVSKKGAAPGWFYNQIQEAIQRIKHTAIDSKGAFYSKGKKKWVVDSFNLYERVVFIGEELDNGEIADTNYLFLGSKYLENINSHNTKPLDYTYYRTLKRPISARLYELLGVKFYRGLPSIGWNYSTLCQLLPITQQYYFSDAKRILKPAHDELIRTGFLANVEWKNVKNDPHDWYVSYYPGTRAKKEIEDGKRGNNHAALPAPDDGVSESVISARPAPQPAPATPPPQPDDDAVSALQDIGISKRKAQKLAKEHPHDYILEKLEQVQWYIDTKSPLVAKNPAGFAIRAIEEDYPPPPGYKEKKHREEERQLLEREEQEARLAAQEEREEARLRLVAEHPPQPIAGTEHTTESAWTKALEALQAQVSKLTYTGWLKDTRLVKVEDNTAHVLVANRMAGQWLERRLYASIARALEEVLGYPVDVEFVVSEATPIESGVS